MSVLKYSKETTIAVSLVLVLKMKHPYHATILVMIISFTMTNQRLTTALLFVNTVTAVYTG